MVRNALVLLVTALAAHGVLAGHADWEPRLYGRTSLVISDAPVVVVENATAHTHEKRWVGVHSGSGNADTRLWPGKTIKYCFDNDDAKSKLFEDLKDGVERWYASGLPEDFKFVEVSATACTSDRNNVLLIKYSAPGTGPGQSVLATSPALQPLSGIGQGPTMTLSDDETMGMLDKVANYAHELGHAWGLYHEHQNPFYWEQAYGRQDGRLFGANNFNCANLKDYATVQQKITDAINNYPGGLGGVLFERHYREVCQVRAVARQYQFSATDYLPFPLADLQLGDTTGDDIDWASIMIYPSGAGGSGTASPGGPDNRLNILTKPDGSKIGKNLYPSPRDVAGLIALYGEVRVEDEPLMSGKKSSRFNKFKDVFKKSKSTGASGVC